MGGYTSSDIRKLYKLTQKQLHDLDHCGIIEPSVVSAQGKGTHRVYSFEDLLAFRFVKRLLDAGLPLRIIKKAIYNLRSILPEKDPLRDCVLLHLNGSILARTTTVDGQMIVIDAASRGQLVMPILISEIHETVREDIKVLSAA